MSRPFHGLLESVLVEPPVTFDFEGAILREHAQAAWRWMLRDLAGDRLASAPADDDPAAAGALVDLLPELLNEARAALAGAAENASAGRRLATQLGSDAARDRLPVVLTALRCHSVLEKAQAFGRATNGMTDETVLATALQAMPLGERPVTALLFQASIGQVTAPSRLVTAAIRLTGSATETAITRAGFAPLLEAILAHAQNQLPLLREAGPFCDVDLACRALDRFHRLLRAVQGYVELNRLGRWTGIIAALTKAVSDRVEPWLKGVIPDINRALRIGPGGPERLDSDQVLAALNGAYLLATVRDCRDSLAVNALFDQTWAQAGQTLQINCERCLDQLRARPDDPAALERVDTAIKLAELRFSAEHAEVLRRARDGALRRGATPG